MSKTWTIVVYSSIGVVATTAAFVAGRITGIKAATKVQQPQPAPQAFAQNPAQA